MVAGPSPDLPVPPYGYFSWHVNVGSAVPEDVDNFGPACALFRDGRRVALLCSSSTAPPQHLQVYPQVSGAVRSPADSD